MIHNVTTGSFLPRSPEVPFPILNTTEVSVAGIFTHRRSIHAEFAAKRNRRCTAKPPNRRNFQIQDFFFRILELLAQLGYIGPNAPCESRAILLNIEEQTNHTQTTKCALDKPLIMQRCGWDKVNKLDGKNPRPTPAFWAQFFEF